MWFPMTFSAFASTREMAHDSAFITSLAVRRAVLLARLLMAAIAPITRCRLPLHSFLSSFRLACVVHLFLIASSGLYQLVGVGSGFKAFRSFDLTSFKVTFVCETS